MPPKHRLLEKMASQLGAKISLKDKRPVNGKDAKADGARWENKVVAGRGGKWKVRAAGSAAVLR
jgi:hypothetical protein